ncbi:MAG: Ig-like domain-containing protein, partial [Deltaproteobacteria bacterium]|nr:Ig-like domain-containing protein [Deltaproteobacteria bacterium]
MQPRRFCTPILVSFLLFGLSCAPRPSGPLSTLLAGRTLGASTNASWQPSATRQPLEVLHRSPTKEAEGLSAIIVTFNQPMVALGTAGPMSMASGACPLRVKPAVRGSCRWVAGDTLKLALEQPLRNARRYSVTIPASIAALSGSKLSHEVSWSFDTPRPELRRVALHPRDALRADRMRRDDALLLTFNVDVDPARLLRSAELRAGGKAVSCEARHYIDPETKRPDAKRVVLKPRALLAPGAKVKLVVPPGFVSAEGPLPSTRPGGASFSTPGPLRVKVLCDYKDLPAGGNCWPMSNRYHRGVELKFSEPVTKKQLMRQLSITPRLTKPWKSRSTWCGKQRCARYWVLQEVLAPSQRYSLRLPGRLKDIFGQHLETPLRTHFRTEALPPGVFMAHDAEGFREAWQPYKVKTVNLRTLQLETTALRGANLVRFIECVRKRHWNWPSRCKAKGIKATRQLSVKGAPDQVHAKTLTLPRGLSRITLSSAQLLLPAKNKGGPLQKVRIERFVTLTDLGLHARMTPFGVTVWVTTLRDGRALAGTEVTLRDTRGKLLWRGKTDALGVAQASRQQLGALLRAKKPPQLYVLAERQGDRAYLTLSRTYWYQSYDRDMPESSQKPAPLEPMEISRAGDWRGDRPLLVGYLSTERGIYRPGHIVHLHGAARRYRTWQSQPAAGLSAEVRLLGKNREIVARKGVKLSALGVFTARLALPKVGRLGYHHAELLVGGRIIATHYLRVAEYRAPRFSVHLKALPSSVIAVEPVALDFAARYLFGGPLDGAPYGLRVQANTTSVELPAKSEHHAGSSPYVVQTERRTWLQREGMLDGQGQGKEQFVVANLGPRPFPSWHRIQLEARSPARRSVSVWRHFTHYPGERLVSVKQLAAKEGAHQRHLLVVDPAGKRHGARVSVWLHPVSYASKKLRSLKVGWKRILWRSSRLVGKKGSVLRVPWPKSHTGPQVLLVLAVKDSAGRETWTAQRLDKPNTEAKRWERHQARLRQRNKQLQITLDKESYLPGQTAVVTVVR